MGTQVYESTNCHSLPRSTSNFDHRLRTSQQTYPSSLRLSNLDKLPVRATQNISGGQDFHQSIVIAIPEIVQWDSNQLAAHLLNIRPIARMTAEFIRLLNISGSQFMAFPPHDIEVLADGDEALLHDLLRLQGSDPRKSPRKARVLQADEIFSSVSESCRDTLHPGSETYNKRIGITSISGRGSSIPLATSTPAGDTGIKRDATPPPPDSREPDRIIIWTPMGNQMPLSSLSTAHPREGVLNITPEDVIASSEIHHLAGSSYLNPLEGNQSADSVAVKLVENPLDLERPSPKLIMDETRVDFRHDRLITANDNATLVAHVSANETGILRTQPLVDKDYPQPPSDKIPPSVSCSSVSASGPSNPPKNLDLKIDDDRKRCPDAQHLPGNQDFQGSLLFPAVWGNHLSEEKGLLRSDGNRTIISDSGVLGIPPFDLRDYHGSRDSALPVFSQVHATGSPKEGHNASPTSNPNTEVSLSEAHQTRSTGLQGTHLQIRGLDHIEESVRGAAVASMRNHNSEEANHCANPAIASVGSSSSMVLEVKTWGNEDDSRTALSSPSASPVSCISSLQAGKTLQSNSLQSDDETLSDADTDSFSDESRQCEWSAAYIPSVRTLELPPFSSFEEEVSPLFLSEINLDIEVAPADASQETNNGANHNVRPRRFEDRTLWPSRDRNSDRSIWDKTHRGHKTLTSSPILQTARTFVEASVQTENRGINLSDPRIRRRIRAVERQNRALEAKRRYPTSSDSRAADAIEAEKPMWFSALKKYLGAKGSPNPSSGSPSQAVQIRSNTGLPILGLEENYSP